MKFKKIAYFSLTLMTLLLTSQSYSTTRLQEKERQSLRYHLENLYNEVDLLIKNQKVNERDLSKLEYHLSELKVFTRIPFESELEQLKHELKASASDHSVELLAITVMENNSRAAPLPHQRSTHSPLIRIQPEQLVKKIYFQAQLRGDQVEILDWLKHIKLEQMRLVDWDHPRLEENLKKIAPHRWLLKAHAFQFRKIEYPELKPKKPKDYLPQWAKSYPMLFAQQEPLLWSFITKTESRLPLASKLYQRKGLFKLNEARLNFFLSKTLDRHSLGNT
ncbi:hypothetical protein EBS43_03350 [bacterium]|jgi:hypothetical protein|nr:hypothetical protein [bacterium]